MGYQVYESRGRDCGYGVPAECDHPHCHESIDRGLGYLCGDRPGDDQFGCGLYFCEDHRVGYRQPRGLDRRIELCSRCWNYRPPYSPKPDVPEWIEWKMTDPSWQPWRDAHPEEVEL
jgi:hypothetical protein